MLKQAYYFVIVCVFIFSGCGRQEAPGLEKYSETEMLMGTIVRLDVCRDQGDHEKIEKAYREIWERLEAISWKMNVFDERGDVAKINSSNLQPVMVGVDTYWVIKAAVDYAEKTGGAFDITVWPLIDLWRRSAERDVFPSSEQMRIAQSAVGYKNIQLISNQRIRLLNENTKIDLGGIAKGYAVDEAARIFREHGIQSFFIDAGGDVYAGGTNCSGKPWRVGIRDPRDPSKMIDVVAVTDRAVVTSGNYEQYYEIQNQRWSHIINPVSGYPQRRVISATVIAPKAMEADALATALCVLGETAGTKYIDSLAGSHASLMIRKAGLQAVEKFPSQEYENFRHKK